MLVFWGVDLISFLLLFVTSSVIKMTFVSSNFKFSLYLLVSWPLQWWYSSHIWGWLFKDFPKQKWWSDCGLFWDVCCFFFGVLRSCHGKKQSPRSPHTWGLIWSHPKNLVTPFYPDVQPLSFFLWDNDKTNMSPAKKGLEDKRFFWCNPCLGDICWFSAVTLSFWGVSFLLVTGPRRPLRMLQNALVGESQARCEKKPPLWMVLKPDHK